VRTAAARRLALAVLIASGAAACGDRGEQSGAGARAGGVGAISPDSPMVAVSAIQLGSYADAASAHALIDSLGRQGWATSLREATVNGGTVWRVQIAPTLSNDLASRIAYTLRKAGRQPLLVRDSARLVGRVDVFPVNRGTHGMSARTRWALSSDRRSMLVVEDPVGVEAEAIPNGFIFASDRGPVMVQQDSVWDVTPSPDWTKLAYGKGYILPAFEGEAVPEATWRRVAAAVKLPLDSVRRNAFMTSGMVPAYGFAQPVVADVSGRAADASISRSARVLPIAGGWRIGWTGDGKLLGIGAKPERVQDDSPSPSWLAVDQETGAVRGPVGIADLGEIAWVDGPVIDISVSIDLGETRSLAIEKGTLESRGGWIRLNGRIVGPGLAVAATRSGQFIAAFAPRPDAREYEATVEPVVYRVGGSR
jgi:hypothetical protein